MLAGCNPQMQALARALYEGVLVHRCGLCRGVLIEGDKMPRILVREEEGFGDAVARAAEVLTRHTTTRSVPGKAKMRDEFSCPGCEKPMRRNFYSALYPIEVDRCLFCKRIWFDTDEIEILQYLVEKNRYEEKT